MWDIIVEWINEDEKACNFVWVVFCWEVIICFKVVCGKEEEGVKYCDYFDFEELLKKCFFYCMLVICWGEEEGILWVYVMFDEDDIIYWLECKYVEGNGSVVW